MIITLELLISISVQGPLRFVVGLYLTSVMILAALLSVKKVEELFKKSDTGMETSTTTTSAPDSDADADNEDMDDKKDRKYSRRDYPMMETSYQSRPNDINHQKQHHFLQKPISGYKTGYLNKRK